MEDDIIECVFKIYPAPIEKIQKAIDKLEIVYPPLEFKNEGNLWYQFPPIPIRSKVAAFDLDWTLSYGEYAMYPHDPKDIVILPYRRRILEKYFKQGYTLMILTNQKASKGLQPSKVERVTNALKMLNLPIFTFIACGEDEFRKPNTGAWTMLELEAKKQGVKLDKKKSFFLW
jgi:DNA 3'-phosphatase